MAAEDSIDPKVKKLIEWIAREAELESAFLTTRPAWEVNAHSLLDAILRIFKIPEKTVSAVVDKISDAKEAAKQV